MVYDGICPAIIFEKIVIVEKLCAKIKLLNHCTACERIATPLSGGANSNGGQQEFNGWCKTKKPAIKPAALFYFKFLNSYVFNLKFH